MSEFMLGRDVDDDEIGTLDTFPLDAVATIDFHTAELQALCPAVAGIQPDIYDTHITFRASTSIESKSLKLWLVTFRDQRIFAEHLAHTIARRIHDTLADDPTFEHVTVRMAQNIRGGIIETVETTLTQGDT